MKSKTCYGKSTKQPLTEYNSLEDAKENADYVSREHNREMIPYKCDKCKMYHLSPTNRHTESTTCSYCTGSDGRPKETYTSKESAEIRANIILKEKGLSLYAYPCEISDGWHLTKRRNS